ncbi:hypothetical protein Trydic_g3606 [Trypoxylus dichotomus]
MVSNNTNWEDDKDSYLENDVTSLRRINQAVTAKEEVSTIIDKLASKTAPGTDGIPNRAIKIMDKGPKKQLTRIINGAIRYSISRGSGREQQSSRRQRRIKTSPSWQTEGQSASSAAWGR